MTRRVRQRAERLQRLLRAQEAIAVAERANRAEADLRRSECEAEGKAIVAALSGDTPLFGVMVPAMANMLKANARDAINLERLCEVARSREATERLRAEHIARKASAAMREDSRRREAQRLEDIGVAWTPPAPVRPEAPDDAN